LDETVLVEKPEILPFPARSHIGLSPNKRYCRGKGLLQWLVALLVARDSSSKWLSDIQRMLLAIDTFKDNPVVNGKLRSENP